VTEGLAPGFYDVPPGMVATVVTYLEMMQPPAFRPAPDGAPEVTVLPSIDTATYRSLFSRVGAQDWLWFSRMQMRDDALQSILDHDDVVVATMMVDAQPEALLELDFRETGQCELAFFGVSPALLGKGAGRALMNTAIELAWQRNITRFHVHTCTLDHPQALSFYRRSGFTPIKQQIEIAPDPRLSGVLPKDAGRHIPIFS
jgi:GNAT superfamily N-acetyltransferase